MACFMCILETHAAILRNPADMILFKCKDATKLASTCAAASLDREGYRGCFIHQFSLTKLLSFPVSLAVRLEHCTQSIHSLLTEIITHDSNPKDTKKKDITSIFYSCS